MTETLDIYLNKSHLMKCLDDQMTYLEKLAKLRKDSGNQNVELELFYLRELLKDMIHVIKTMNQPKGATTQ